MALVLLIGLLLWSVLRPPHRIPDRVFAAACKSNLGTIADAKTRWAQAEHKTTNDTPSWSDLIGPSRYLRSQPECARGGMYSLGRVGEPPHCTLPGHTL
jgi:hypothetical protein